MSATNQNQEIDSLEVTEQPDGSFEITWDKNDPKWSFMNGLTQEEVTAILTEGLEKLKSELEND
jgi:hypothetical protein